MGFSGPHPVWRCTQHCGHAPCISLVSPKCMTFGHPRLQVRGLLHYVMLCKFQWQLLRLRSLHQYRLLPAMSACHGSIATTVVLHEAKCSQIALPWSELQTVQSGTGGQRSTPSSAGMLAFDGAQPLFSALNCFTQCTRTSRGLECLTSMAATLSHKLSTLLSRTCHIKRSTKLHFAAVCHLQTYSAK